MGLFSSKKVVYVASVAYNMAGPVTDRLSVLKSTVSRHILLGEKKVSFGQRFIDTQLNGPTIDQRQWFRWTQNHYEIGQVTGQLSNQQALSSAAVEPHLDPPTGYYYVVNEAFIDTGDIQYFAERYMCNNHPTLFDTNWNVDYIPSTGSMLIQFEDLTSVTVSVPGFSTRAFYVVATLNMIPDGQPPTTSGERKVFIYKIGTGNATLDALHIPDTGENEFFPVIPLRIVNKPISHLDFDDHYEAVAKAYKKAMGGSIEDVLTQIEENENIDDVDYATVMFGVELTTQEKCGLRYIYQFFSDLRAKQKVTPAGFYSWAGMAGPVPGGTVLEHRPTPTLTTIKTTGSEAAGSITSHIDNRLTWITIDESLHTGVGKVGAKRGDLWFVSQADIRVRGPLYYDDDLHDYVELFWASYELPYARLFWQIDSNNYKVLHIYGMVHRNYVYGGKAVELSTKKALTGDDEEGFIVPLHYPTLRKLPLILSNQLALSNRHIIFNCYQVVKIRWYQRGIFKVLISIVLGIIMAFVFPGSIGLLGTALNVGTSLGFTGLTAIIIGATVNALASIVLMSVIEKAAIGIFGEELGGLLGQIFSFFAFQFVQGWATGVPFTVDWGSLMRIDNLMKLLSTGIDAVSAWINGEMVKIQGAMEDAAEKYQDDWKDLEKKALDLLGAGGGVIDPLMFTETQSRFHMAESRDAFLQRTLMTGTDLIDLSISMIEDYVDLNLTLDHTTS